jgi:DNA-binding MarR family transcriptional regulator
MGVKTCILIAMTTTLQEELQQTKPFGRLAGEALVSVMRTAAVLDHALGEALKPHGITPTQYNVLRILRGAGERGLCGRDVGSRLVSRVPDVPRLLDRMTEMGLISRERDADDRRHVTARITPAALRLMEDVEPILERVETSRFGGLDDDTLRVLIDALAAVRQNG